MVQYIRKIVYDFQPRTPFVKEERDHACYWRRMRTANNAREIEQAQ